MSELPPRNNFENSLPDYTEWMEQDRDAPWQPTQTLIPASVVEYPKYFSNLSASQLFSIADRWAKSDTARLPLYAATYDRAHRHDSYMLAGRAALLAARISRELDLPETEVTLWALRSLGALRPDEDMSFDEQTEAYELIAEAREEFVDYLPPKPHA